MAAFLANSSFHSLSVIQTPDLDVTSGWVCLLPSTAEPRGLLGGRNVSFSVTAFSVMFRRKGGFWACYYPNSHWIFPGLIPHGVGDWRGGGQRSYRLNFESTPLDRWLLDHHLGFHLLVSSTLEALCQWGCRDSASPFQFSELGEDAENPFLWES